MAGLGLLLDPLSEFNPLPNASFEGDTAYWTLAAPLWTSSSVEGSEKAWVGSSGTYALRVQAKKDAAAETQRNLQVGPPQQPALPGIGYSLSAALNIIDSASLGVRAQINWRDASGAVISTNAGGFFLGNGITELSMAATAPALTASAEALIFTASKLANDTVDFYVDMVEFGPTNVPVDLNDGNHFRAMDFKCPPPARKVTWASSADTEGSLPASVGYENRPLTITSRVFGTSDSDLAAQLGALEQKVGKINEEGGTLQVTMPSGKVAVFDLFEGEADFVVDNVALANRRAEVTITFAAAPFWRAGKLYEVAGINHAETTLPVVLGTDSLPEGDVPALGRLVIDEDQGKDQWTALWAIQSRYYDPSPNAELFYQAEGRTGLAGEKKTGPSGASGAGENTIFCNALIATYQPLLSTQASGGGAHLSHVGGYRVFARVYRPSTKAGQVSVALEWAQGDFLKPTRNEAKVYAEGELENQWTLADLGLINIDPVTAGTQRWEGRVLAKSSTPGDEIYVDCLLLVPVDEGYGVLKIDPSSATPTTLVAHDEFNQEEEANLDKPLALPLGGNWSEVTKTGASGFKVLLASHVAQRTTVSDANLNSGCYVLAGTTSYAAVQVQAMVKSNGYATTVPYRHGVLARYVDTNNWLMAVREGGSGGVLYDFVVLKRVAGTVTELGRIKGMGSGEQTFVLTALANGSWSASASSTPGALSGVDADLATGGTLASGKPGFYDALASATARTRTVDNFAVFTGVTADAAIYASQSLEVRSDRVVREDSGGTLWVPRPDYKGNYFRPPVSRREGRTLRTIVKLSRGNIDSMTDPGIDDASFRIFWQSRGLVLPES